MNFRRRFKIPPFAYILIYLPYFMVFISFFILDSMLILGTIENPLRGLALRSNVLFPVVGITTIIITIFSVPEIRKRFYRFLRIPDKFISLEISESSKQSIVKLIFILAMITIFLGACNIKMQYKLTDIVRGSDDTSDIVRITENNPLQKQFWIGYKPPLLPLLIWCLGYRNGEESHLLHIQVSDAQFIISIIAWATLACSFVIHLHSKISRLLGFALILFMGATLDISLWDRLTMTESLSTSTFLFWVSSVAIFLYLIIEHQSLWKLFSCALWIAVATFFYITSRDTNAYYIFYVGGLLGLIAFFGHFRNAQRISLAVIATLFILSFGVYSRLFSQSVRWHPVIMDLYTDRLASNPDAVNYLVNQGMPPVNQILADHSYPNFKAFTESQRFRIIDDGAPGSFEYWFVRDAKTAYIKYILTHPTQLLITPFLNWKDMILENNYEYREPNGPLPKRISVITKIFYPDNISYLLSLLSIVSIGFGILVIKKRMSNIFWFQPISMFLAIFFMIPLIWVGGSLEITRHSIQISTQLRLALWLGITLLIDEIINIIKIKNK